MLIFLKENLKNTEENKLELPLFLLSQMHHMIAREDKDLAKEEYQQLLGLFFEIDFLSVNSKIVSIIYFEI